MSTLELKSSIKDKSSSMASKKTSTLSLKSKSNGATQAMSAPDSTPQSSQSSEPSRRPSGASILTSATGSLAFDLESLHQKMNSMLCRASQATVQEEDEADAKMRQLLEEIYSVPSQEEYGLSLYDSSFLQEEQHGDGEEKGGDEEGDFVNQETKVGRESSFREIF